MQEKIQGSFLTSEESKMQIQVAKNVTTTDDNQSESSYQDDFESTFNRTESFGAYDNSFVSSKLSDSKTFKMQKNNGEPLDEDDMLLQGARHLHQKIKAQHRKDHNVAQ